MKDRLVGHLGLAVGLRVSHSGELSLAAQAAEIVCEPTSVKLPPVIKDDGTTDAKAGDDVPQIEATASASIHLVK